MKILGIESSCDETAAAVVEDGTKVLSNIIASQIPLHEKTGGVVPEVAAREHVLKVVPVIQEALESAKITIEDIDAIAVTRGPGLLSSLVIGTTAASVLATYHKKTLIPLNHIAGHIYANWLGQPTQNEIQFPLIVLTVSGGHNELVLMKSHTNFQLLGETQDDAAGEAFDKVARLLGLGYPGGPKIGAAAENGNRHKYPFPRAYMGKDSLNYSFSGLKTAVLNQVHHEIETQGSLSQEFINDCAASFEHTVCDILSDKLLLAAQKYNVKEVHLAGGVSANKYLRKLTQEKVDQKYYNDHQNRKQPITIPLKLRYSSNFSYCTDNAAMIASAAYYHYIENPTHYTTPANILADPGLSLYY